MSTYKDQDFLETLVKAIVSKPEDVKITRTVDQLGVLYTLTVAQEDVSKVIGKQGQTAKAIRLLLKVVGFNEKVRANLKIDAPRVEARIA